MLSTADVPAAARERRSPFDGCPFPQPPVGGSDAPHVWAARESWTVAPGSLRAASGTRLALLSPPHPVEQLDTAMTGKITSRHRRNRLDLNSEGDRDYLSSRGFVYALISVGAYRGRVISAHHQRKTVEAYVRDFALNRPVEIVEIAKFA